MPAALRFDNRFVTELPGDEGPPTVPRQVHGACWSAAAATPVRAPRLLAAAHEVAALVGIDDAETGADWFAEVFAGNRLLDGMRPFAACYGGHQFGHWAGQLGDGRAISLGETVNARGERWELQLKGAGPTPYSRRADGRAVLRSSIREFLCSEAMFHLGIPTTRALCVVTTGEQVLRDMFYDGNPALEPGAVVCRVAPSFLRFGNFELPATRGEVDLLGRLVDFTIDRDFPHIEGTAPERRATWFAEVCERTARLAVEWMRVGFVHGVMNTDNMSILGLTIDYGPYGWLDDFDPNWTPNTTDAGGRRYRFGAQPEIAQWNLLRLADALHPVMGSVDPLQAGIDRYGATYEEGYGAMIGGKFGLDLADDGAFAIVQRGFELLYRAEMDHTNFFRSLGEMPDVLPDGADARLALLGDVFYSAGKRDERRDRLLEWLADWHRMATQRTGDAAARRAAMHRVNPKFILRNYLAQEAIDRAAAGDPSGVIELLDVMRRPYDDQPGRERFAARRPEWARSRAGCSMLSCSS